MKVFNKSNKELLNIIILLKEDLLFTYKIESRPIAFTKWGNSFYVEFIIAVARFPRRNISEIIVCDKKVPFIFLFYGKCFLRENKFQLGKCNVSLQCF